MKSTLSLTHRCNLACTYCYAGQSRSEDMSFETAQKIVDFTLDSTPAGQPARFCFFGGEPLLCFDLMTEITGYVREQQRRTGKQVALSLTTNGTILTEAVLDFVEAETVDLCISLDGLGQAHDRHRRYPNGRASFGDVVGNLRTALERLDMVQVNAVYEPDTLDDLPASVSFFVELGIRFIHLNPNVLADWTETARSRLPAVYRKIADQVVESYSRGREIAIKPIESKIIVLLKGGYRREDQCPARDAEWAFAPSGNVYACERFIGEDTNPSLRFGNIHTGVRLTGRCSLLGQGGKQNPQCLQCQVRQYCMNWCGCTNYHLTGQTDTVGSMLCEHEQATLGAAAHALDELKENELFLDHICRYWS